MFIDQKDLDGDGIGDICDLEDRVCSNEDVAACISQIDCEINGGVWGGVCMVPEDGFYCLNSFDNCFTKMSCEFSGAEWRGDEFGDSWCYGDSDVDLVDDVLDNCLLENNPNQLDLDGDGFGDICDDDLDGDGVLNELDNCPINPNSVSFFENYRNSKSSLFDIDNFDVRINRPIKPNNVRGDVVRLEIDSYVSLVEPVSGLSYFLPDGTNIKINSFVESSPLNHLSYSVGQKDIDADGIGDVCDDNNFRELSEDFDHDGVLNEFDLCDSYQGEFVDLNGCGYSICEEIFLSCTLNGCAQKVHFDKLFGDSLQVLEDPNDLISLNSNLWHLFDNRCE
jgi:hypothetical protein